jgi:acyl-CoA synthetase (AMP-forming)/AMP-acid ligase II
MIIGRDEDLTIEPYARPVDRRPIPQAPRHDLDHGTTYFAGHPMAPRSSATASANRGEASARRVRGEAFLTGDLGYRDDADFIYFAGRSGDWLRVDSENFAAAPIEAIIARYGLDGWFPYAAEDTYIG